MIMVAFIGVSLGFVVGHYAFGTPAHDTYTLIFGAAVMAISSHFSGIIWRK